MAGAISAEQHTQIVALLQTGSGISEIARKCKVSRPTVYDIQSKLSSSETAPARPALSKAQVADKIRCIAESSTSKPSDKLSAWKLYSLMHGLISENEAKSAQVLIQTVGNVDVSVLEKEYAELTGRKLGALESPTTHEIKSVDTMSSPSASDAIVGQPGETACNSVEAGDSKPGGSPPASDGNGI